MCAQVCKAWQVAIDERIVKLQPSHIDLPYWARLASLELLDLTAIAEPLVGTGLPVT